MNYIKATLEDKIYQDLINEKSNLQIKQMLDNGKCYSEEMTEIEKKIKERGDWLRQKIKINEKLNGKTELQRAFDILSEWSEAYQQRIDKHYKDIQFLNKEKKKAEARIKKCLEKAKEYGIDLKINS